MCHNTHTVLEAMICKAAKHELLENVPPGKFEKSKIVNVIGVDSYIV